MKQPKLGQHMRVIIAGSEYAAMVQEIKRNGDIVCRVHKPGLLDVMTFDKNGHGYNGARLHPVKRARGVRVAGAVE